MWKQELRTPSRTTANLADTGTPSRINVAVNDVMLEAIDTVIASDAVTLTEAVRRLLGYGEFVYQVQRTPGYTLIVRDQNGRESKVVSL